MSAQGTCRIRMLGVHALRMNSKRKLCKCENRTVAWRAHPSRYQGPTTHLAPRFRFSNQVRVRFHPPRRTRTRPRTLPPTPHVHPATYTACAPCRLQRLCTLPPTTHVHPAAYSACAPCRLHSLCTLPLTLVLEFDLNHLTDGAVCYPAAPISKQSAHQSANNQRTVNE